MTSIKTHCPYCGRYRSQYSTGNMYNHLCEDGLWYLFVKARHKDRDVNQVIEPPFLSQKDMEI